MSMKLKALIKCSIEGVMDAEASIGSDNPSASQSLSEVLELLGLAIDIIEEDGPSELDF